MIEKKQLNIRPEIALVENNMATDVEHARSLLACGLVFLGDIKLTARSLITNDDIAKGLLRVKYNKPYVSRGAIKLETVFNEYNLDVSGFRCADIGASTGGFTELLIKKGASFIFAVDVGKGILDYKLRIDKRVMVFEGINARLFDSYDVINKNIKKESLDLVVFDLSFISIKMVEPVVLPYVKKGAYVVPLIKPQFEAKRAELENGVVKDQRTIDRVLEDTTSFFGSQGLEILGVTASQIKGPMGNQEYFYIMIKK